MLTTKFLNHILPNPIMNSAGVFDTTEEELLHLDKTPNISAIVSKSTTYNSREGNDHPRYFHDPYCSVNSTGLANNGYLFYDKMATKLKKPYIVSVASLDSIEEMKKVIDHLAENPKITAIEINLSCPNIVGKSQPAYDFPRFDEYLKTLTTDLTKPWGIKLPPYFDNQHYKEAANILKKYKPHYICCINSIPLALHIDPIKEKYSIKPNNGRGGMGGLSIRQVALANVQTFRQLMPPDTVIIGCGGITSGFDLFEHILAGANLVQIGTQLIRDTPRKATDRIINELEQLLIKKEYKTLTEVIPLCQREEKEEPFSNITHTPFDENRPHEGQYLLPHLSLPFEEEGASPPSSALPYLNSVV
jgi:dihydroorotate dehydrogenase (fumarate)